MPKISGRKEVGEAVVIAALCAFVTQAVTWGMDEVRRKQEAKRQQAAALAKKKGKKRA